MKRWWLVFLSLGLIAIFGSQAMAVDVKFSGEFKVGGLYLDNTGLTEDNSKPSTAFYFQRLRLRTDFVVDKGLKLVTRADIMERIWGGARGSDSDSGSVSSMAESPASRYENENIGFDLAYIEYISPIGLFQIGYLMQSNWGCDFSNSAENGATTGGIAYIVPVGPVYLAAVLYKNMDGSTTAVSPAPTGGTPASDADFNVYQLAAVYKPSETVQAGLIYKYYRVAATKPLLDAFNPYVLSAMGFSPYFKAQLGPVYVEGEMAYGWGDMKYEKRKDGIEENDDIEEADLVAYLSATADFGIAYLGGTFAYISGDDPATDVKKEGGVLEGGKDWNPCLLMWNYERNYWAGSLDGYDSSKNTTSMTNAIFFQLKGGVRPIDKLDIMASVSFATADKTPAMRWAGRDYGWEVDLTATYKLTDNPKNSS